MPHWLIDLFKDELEDPIIVQACMDGEKLNTCLQYYYALIAQGVSPKVSYGAVCDEEKLSVEQMQFLWDKLLEQSRALSEGMENPAIAPTAAEITDSLGQVNTTDVGKVIDEVLKQVKHPLKKAKIKLSVSGASNKGAEV